MATEKYKYEYCRYGEHGLIEYGRTHSIIKGSLDESQAAFNISIDNNFLTNVKITLPLVYELDFFNIPNGSSENLHKITNNVVDKYLLHTFEEVMEFYQEFKYNLLKSNEFYLSSNAETTIYEIIDILGYCYSLRSIFVSYLYGFNFDIGGNMYEMNKSKGIITLSENAFHNIIHLADSFKLLNYDDISTIDFKFLALDFKKDNEYICKTINNLILDGELNLIDLRRLYDERKYHKKVNRELHLSQLCDLFKQSINLIDEALKKFFTMYMIYEHAFLVDNNPPFKLDDTVDKINKKFAFRFIQKHFKVLNSCYTN